MEQIISGEVVKVVIEAKTQFGENYNITINELTNLKLDTERDYLFFPSPYKVSSELKFCLTGKAESFVLEMNPEEKHPEIENVIYHDPAVIVFWKDGTKTVVKVQDGEVFDKEKGFAMAVLKKMFGNKGNYYNEIRKWVK